MNKISTNEDTQITTQSNKDMQSTTQSNKDMQSMDTQPNEDTQSTAQSNKDMLCDFLTPNDSILLRQVIGRTVRRYDPVSLIEHVTLSDCERIATDILNAYRIGTIIELSNAVKRMDDIFSARTTQSVQIRLSYDAITD